MRSLFGVEGKGEGSIMEKNGKTNCFSVFSIFLISCLLVDGKTHKEYRDTVWTCRDGIKKAKARKELDLVKDVKNSKAGFYRYIGQKRQA